MSMTLFRARISIFLPIMALLIYFSSSQLGFATEAAGLFSPTKEEVIETVTLKDMDALLKDRGISATRTKSNDGTSFLYFELSGNDTLILLRDCKKKRCGVIKMATLFPGNPLPSFNKINDFNKRARYVRAYNDDNTSFIESDISLEGGHPLEAVEGFITRHHSMTAIFAEHIGYPFSYEDQWQWTEISGEQPDSMMDGYTEDNSGTTTWDDSDAVTQPVTKPVAKPKPQKPVKKTSPAIEIPDPATGFALEITPTDPGYNIAEWGFPVEMVVHNNSATDIVKLMLPISIIYENEDGKQHREVSFQYSDVAAGEKSGDQINIPVQSVEQIKLVKIRWIADCDLAGNPTAVCDQLLTAASSTVVPIKLPSGATVDGSVTQPVVRKEKVIESPVSKDTPDSLLVNLITTMEPIEGMGCPLGLEVVNNTAQGISELEMVLRFRQQGGGPLDETFAMEAIQPGAKSMAFKLLEPDCEGLESATLRAVTRCTGDQGQRLDCSAWIEIGESDLIHLSNPQ